MSLGKPVITHDTPVVGPGKPVITHDTPVVGPGAAEMLTKASHVPNVRLPYVVFESHNVDGKRYRVVCIPAANADDRYGIEYSKNDDALGKPVWLGVSQASSSDRAYVIHLRKLVNAMAAHLAADVRAGTTPIAK